METINLLACQPISRKTYDFINLFKNYKRLITFHFYGDFSWTEKAIIKFVYKPFHVDFFKFFSEFNSSDCETVFVPLEEKFISEFLNFLKDCNETKIRYHLPDLLTFELAIHKKHMCEFFSNEKDVVPQIYQSIDEIRFPVVVKPSIGSGSRGLKYVTKSEQIRDYFFSDNYVIQEKLNSERSVYGIFCLAKNGEIIENYAHRRIRTYPTKGGVSVFSEIIPLRKEMKRLLNVAVQTLNWNGVLMIETMYDYKGALKIIEINPRFWGSLLLGAASPGNFIFKYLNEILGTNTFLGTKTKKSKILWIFPFGIKYLLNKDVLEAIIKGETYFINFSNSSLIRSFYFHFILYVKKIIQKGRGF